MTRLALVLGTALTLAACGADGEPVTPVAQADISLSNHGVHAVTKVGVKAGPVTIKLGF